MKVKKENRVLSVDKADEAFYLSEGYDVVELDKEKQVYITVKEATGGKTYSVAEYNALKNELDSLKESGDFKALEKENKNLKSKVKKLEKELKDLLDSNAQTLPKLEEQKEDDQ